MRRGDPCFVYFMRQADGGGPVKIGCSVYPEGRLSAYMAWAPYPLVLAATTPGDEDLERRLHFRFWGQHSHREWFHQSADLDALIADVNAGVFDGSKLVPGKRPSAIYRSGESRAASSVSLRLTHMGYWGYPIPPSVVAASRNHWHMTAEQIRARRALVAKWVNEHHPIAHAMYAVGAQRKRAA